MDKIKLGITTGDTNGIGYEVIMKALADNRILQYCTPIIYGSSKVASLHRKLVQLNDFNYHPINSLDQANPKKVNLYNVVKDEAFVNIGEATPESGKSAYESIVECNKDLKEGKIDAIVTAPINKSNIYSENFPYRGHTEYFADQYKSKDYLMLLVNDHLKIGTVTGHIPVNEISKQLTKEKILSKLRVLNTSLEMDFGINTPKIAVLGLNPHAGDKGLIGKEDDTIILDAINAAKAEGIKCFGPYPADGFFGAGHFNSFDAVLAMYHDQGLVPFKLMSFSTGVNYTAGLTVVRTSPDHGTGYDIAGKNEADENSMRQAIFLAIDIVKKRKEFKALESGKIDLNRLKDEKRKLQADSNG